MSDRGALRTGIAAMLRVGTVVAMGIIAGGYLLGIAASSMEGGGGPLLDQLAGGGPSAIVGAGLLALTLVPVGVVAVALLGFARSGERRLALTAAAVLTLLVASLAVAAIVASG